MIKTVSPSLRHIQNFFSLKVYQKKKVTDITMKMFVGLTNTSGLPETLDILHNRLPKIYLHQCFNKDGLTFIQEVRQTEIGHLFEHILLEYLSILKNREDPDCVIKGATRWDWNNDPCGTFHIKINLGYQDREIFSIALERSINLLKIILRPKITKNLVQQSILLEHGNSQDD